jgi:L-alanine-DL-glutamate epimerase-like enolase superfamily enzyme
MRAEFSQVDWPFASPFRIAYRVQDVAETVQVKLTEGSLTGRGEGMAVSYHGETIESILAQLESVKDTVERGVSRAELMHLLPAGGARNALDCALWDLEAKRAGQRAWILAGLTTVRPLTSAFTLSLDTPEAMAEVAASVPRYPILKLKLNGERDVERVSAVRRVRPDATLVVDANQAWDGAQVRELVRALAQLGVKLIEQPLPVGKDHLLAGFESPVPLCADESCQTTDSLGALSGKYQYVNIKLDKTGGLTEALRLARAAQAYRFKLMVGCMAGSSLAMAPAFIVGQFCDVIDLDGPLLSAADVAHPIRYEGSTLQTPEAELWG